MIQMKDMNITFFTVDQTAIEPYLYMRKLRGARARIIKKDYRQEY